MMWSGECTRKRAAIHQIFSRRCPAASLTALACSRMLIASTTRARRGRGSKGSLGPNPGGPGRKRRELDCACRRSRRTGASPRSASQPTGAGGRSRGDESATWENPCVGSRRLDWRGSVGFILTIVAENAKRKIDPQRSGPPVGNRSDRPFEDSLDTQADRNWTNVSWSVKPSWTCARGPQPVGRAIMRSTPWTSRLRSSHC